MNIQVFRNLHTSQLLSEFALNLLQHQYFVEEMDWIRVEESDFNILWITENYPHVEYSHHLPEKNEYKFGASEI